MLGAIIQIKRQSPNLNLVLESAMNPSETDFQSVSHLTNLIVDALKTIKDDNQRLNEELSKYEDMSNNSSKLYGQLKLSTDETNSFVEGLKLNIGVLEQDAAALREQVEHREHVSYDGTCIWKITGFREKLSKSSSLISVELSFLLFSGCSVRETNVGVFTTFLLVTHRLQNAGTSILAWRWSCPSNTHVIILRLDAQFK